MAPRKMSVMEGNKTDIRKLSAGNAYKDYTSRLQVYFPRRINSDVIDEKSQENIIRQEDTTTGFWQSIIAEICTESTTLQPFTAVLTDIVTPKIKPAVLPVICSRLHGESMMSMMKI